MVTTNMADRRRHMDHKDDHRQFYNHCFVYSFSKIVHGIEDKTSIIVTTGRDVGSAMEKINQDNFLNNKRKLNILYH